MAPTSLNRVLVATLAVISAISAIDAAIDGNGDLFVVLAISGVVSLMLLARLELSRPPIPLRRVWVSWLRNRAAMSGEPIGAVTGRALVDYQERYVHAAATSESEQ